MHPMTTTSEKTADATPPVVDRAAYEQAWAQQIADEKELTRHGDRVSAARRRLPMTAVDDYTFTGPDGPVSLSELCGEHRLLVVQHVMFHPDWDDGCPSCTWAANNLPDKLGQLLGREGISFAMVSRAPIEKLRAWGAKQGWDHLTWVSSAGTTYNQDWGWTQDDGDQPGYSYYLLVDGAVYLTYYTTRRGTEAILPVAAIMDRTVYGRQQDWEDSPDGWPQEPTYG